MDQLITTFKNWNKNKTIGVDMPYSVLCGLGIKWLKKIDWTYLNPFK